MDMTDPNNLTNVLKMLSANNTETVRQGEKILKPFAKKPDSIIHLLQQLRGCPDATVRHHAALLMKKKIGVHYSKFNGQNQSELKTQILGVMLSEPEKPVAVAIAGAASLLAKSVFARNEAWPEMFQMLVTLSQDPNERLRALNFSFMGQVLLHLNSQ